VEIRFIQKAKQRVNMTLKPAKCKPEANRLHEFESCLKSDQSSSY
jgi:hypothetical protein